MTSWGTFPTNDHMSAKCTPVQIMEIYHKVEQLRVVNQSQNTMNKLSRGSVVVTLGIGFGRSHRYVSKVVAVHFRMCLESH
jgi:hypothetical protein